MVNVVHIYSHVLTIMCNDCVKSDNFPVILKYAYITPVFKKGDRTDKTNYTSVSILSNVSNVFEKNSSCPNQFIYGTQTVRIPNRFPSKAYPTCSS